MIDLLVAGGGPAGLATALHAARAGLAVTVIEPRPGPIDKACGEGLMPHTLRQLERIGVQPAGVELRGIRYLDEGHQVQAAFRAGPGRGVRRTVLHTALREAAGAAGVTMVTAEVGDVSQDSDCVRVGGHQARYLAAADGLHSPIRRALGLARPSRGPRRWGIRRHVEIQAWTDYVEVHWAAGAEAYVTPVGPGMVGVAVLSSQRAGFDEHLAQFDQLAQRLQGHPHGDDRAAGPLRQTVRTRAAGRVLLVGDAAGYVDALTGEGLGLAFGAAALLVACVAADRPGDYDRQWRQMSRRYRLLTAGLLAASGHPGVRGRLVPAASRLPAVFGLAVNQLAT
jgi:flavin-dependent dehydrogenase